MSFLRPSPENTGRDAALADADSAFRDDPLGFLDRASASADAALPIGRNGFIVRDPEDARAVLRNGDGRYREHSDFFHTRRGVFGPASAQLKIRRESRALLRAYLEAGRERALPAFVEGQLTPTSEWPDFGNRLAYRYLAPLLLAPDSPPRLRRLLGRIVERAVLANARARQPRLRRMLLQFATTLQLSRAIERRQQAARAQPVDLLDVVAGAIGPGQRLDELTEVFLSFVFAIAGSVGFVLGWSMYLIGTHPDRTAPPEWVVQEALRLWPVAWLLARHPAQDHDISGVAVGAHDDVIVCPYGVHRNPNYWPQADDFLPGRWSTPESWRNPAFIPFGHGPHRCVAADLSPRLVADILGIVMRSRTVTVEPHSTRPNVAAALAPPYFRLTLHPRG